MMSCHPQVMPQYKRLIDDGFSATFGEGLRIEGDASRAFARSVTPEQIAARRTGIQDRGREQSRR
jgi:enoyl-CoA hydratase